MKEEILTQLNHPEQLEKLYRSNKLYFKQTFNGLYPQLKGNSLADFWNERLNYENDEISWGNKKEIIVVIVSALIAGLITKLPAFFTIDEEFFYTRNAGFIIFPILMIYFAWKNKLSASKISILIIATLAGLIYTNLLPNNPNSDTLILSNIHIALFLWSLLAFSFVGNFKNNDTKRLDFLKYNGDLIVMTTLIVITGFITSQITVALFSLIGFNIAEYFFLNVALFALPSAPILGTYLTQSNPQLVGKVSPVIARIFSPLVLVMLIVYLVAIVYSGKDPYNDRSFLLMFNILLIGVMALIVFSIAETSKTAKSRVEIWILFLLSAVTIVINLIALSAILFRISEWGLTPNRAAVSGSNILMLIHLLMVASTLAKVLYREASLQSVGKSITVYLPVYFIWTIIVTFLFPLIWNFQ